MTIPTPANMYIIGKIIAVAEEHGDIPLPIFETLPHRPMYGIGMLNSTECWKKSAADKSASDELAMLFGKSPGDLSDPPGGVKEDGQGSFWIGYYHRKNLRDEEGRFTPSMLNEAGNLLFGEHWQKPMAEALGLSDTARIRGWLSGSQKIPVGVWSEIDGMLRKRSSRLGALLEAAGSDKEPKNT